MCRDGIDGSWSTFWMSIGSPPQTLRLLPSTTGDAIWPVLPQGCTRRDPSNCADLRGAVFNPDNSTSWSGIGLFELGVAEERGLGYSGNASVGYDDIRIGNGDASSLLVRNQTVEGFATKDFHLGTIGLSPNAVNLSLFSNSTDSFLAGLKNSSMIPSLSWGYTAGVSYAQPPAFGSLTLGGYDSSRFEPHDVTFPFGPELNRELLLYLNRIGSSSALLSSTDVGIYALLDSLVTDLWLPTDLCEKLGAAFSLEYNSTANRYFINDTIHQSLVTLNPTFYFLLGSGPSSATINITVQYNSFDLVSKSLGVGNVEKMALYFPLRQAKNATQYTIGRAFFQNIYLIADYERHNFSVHQAILPDLNSKQNIVRISSPGANDIQRVANGTNTSKSPNGLSKGAKTGIAVPVTVVGLAAILALAYWLRRKRQLKASKPLDESLQDDFRKPELDAAEEFQKTNLDRSEVSKPELPAMDDYPKPELPGGVQRPGLDDPKHTPELSENDRYGPFHEADADAARHEMESTVSLSDAPAGISSKERSIHELQGSER